MMDKEILAKIEVKAIGKLEDKNKIIMSCLLLLFFVCLCVHATFAWYIAPHIKHQLKK